MSNYTSENLINVKPSQVPAGTLAVKIGEDVFTAGSVTVGEEVTAGYFAKDGDDLKFYPAGSQTGEVVSEIMIADTGKEEPQYEGGSGSSMNFYKCASVGTGTWTGYLASVDSTTGVWSFASTATTGLTYDRLTPVVGSVYDANCSFLVRNYKTGLPEDGLVFYAPLVETVQPFIGPAVTTVGSSVAHGLVDGIPCVTLYNTRLVVSDLRTFPTSRSPWTVSIWAKWSGSYYSSSSAWLVYWGANEPYKSIYLGVLHSNSKIAFGLIADDHQTNLDLNSWSHLLYSFSGSSFSLYVNGTLVSSFSNSRANIGATNFTIGGDVVDDTSFFNGSISAVRLYDRVLDSSEISALANEFTPTAS